MRRAVGKGDSWTRRWLIACVSLGLSLGGCTPAHAPGKGEEPASSATPVRSVSEVRLYAVDRYEGVRRLDPGTLEVLDTIETGARPHGIVASPDGRLLFITVETSNEVLKIEVATHQIVARVEVGPVPNEPALTRDGRYLIVPQRGGEHADVVDTEAMAVVKSLATGRAGHNAYTCSGGKHVYVTSMGDELISVIDRERLEIDRQIPVGGVPRPVALTRDESLAYVALSGLTGFITLDLAKDEVVDRFALPVPPGTPVPPLDTYTHGLLLTPDERELWVAAYATDKVYGFLMPEKAPLAEIAVDRGPHWLTLHPDGEPLYVSLEGSGDVVAIHRGLREVIRRSPVGKAPTRVLAFRAPAEPRAGS